MTSLARSPGMAAISSEGVGQPASSAVIPLVMTATSVQIKGRRLTRGTPPAIPQASISTTEDHLGHAVGTAEGDLGDSLGTTQGHLEVPELLSIPAAAKWLGISPATLYRMIRDDKVPVQIFGSGQRKRVARRQLERWLEGDTPRAAATETTTNPGRKPSVTSDFFSWPDERDGGPQADRPSRRRTPDPVPRSRGRTH